MRDTLGAEHPVVQEVDAVLAGDGAPARQSGAHFLAPFEQLVRDEPLVLALIPLFTPTGGLLAFAQGARIDGFGMGHPPRIHPVLQHIAHHLLVDRLLARPQFLNDRLRVHPIGDLLVAEIPGRIHPKSAAHNHSHTHDDVEACRAFRCRFFGSHQQVSDRSHAAVELPAHGALLLGALGVRTQIPGEHRRLDCQHLFDHRPVEAVVIILADPLNTIELELVLMAQKRFHNDRLLEVTRQSIKLPDHQRVKPAHFGGFLHLLEPVSVQAPAVFRPILIHPNDDTPALADGLTADDFLVFQTDFILHIRGITGIDGETHPFVIVIA
ncbi:MAG TPA: hypothetical protein PLD57_02290 [Aggregatilineales bacterium]|nr:hypothetical protein [Aggregatilineales bacterium]